MAEDDAAGPRFAELLRQSGTVVIGQMPVLREDTQLQIRRVGAHAQHIGIVIGLDQNRIRPQETLQDFLRDTTHIRRHREDALAFYAVADALLRIMRGMESVDQHPVQKKALADRNDPDTAFNPRKHPAEAVCDRMRRADRYVRIPNQGTQPGNMIGVLMRDEHSADIAPGNPSLCQTRRDPAHRDSGVKQNMGIQIGKQQAVPA